MEYRFMPPVQRLLAGLGAGSAGRLRMIAIREHRFPFLVKAGDWNRFSPNTGGTLVWKCSHFVDLMRLMAGARLSIFGQAGQHRRPDRTLAARALQAANRAAWPAASWHANASGQFGSQTVISRPCDPKQSNAAGITCRPVTGAARLHPCANAAADRGRRSRQPALAAPPDRSLKPGDAIIRRFWRSSAACRWCRGSTGSSRRQWGCLRQQPVRPHGSAAPRES